MATAIACSKCGRKMEEGFIVDNTYGGRRVSSWTAGKPEKSFWTGVSLKGKSPIDIATFRCAGCGFLESFAI